MKTQTEIGTLLEMIDAARWDLAIDVDDSEDGRTVWVTIRPRETSDTRGQSDFSGKTILEALQKTVAFTNPPKQMKSPQFKSRAFEKVCNAQANINRQLHGNGKADFRKVRKWLSIRNKWLSRIKRK